MIRFGALIAFVTSLIFFWHECGEDLAVFCYRIGLGAFAGLRSRAPGARARCKFTPTLRCEEQL